MAKSDEESKIDLLELIKTRRSVRKFKDMQVEWHKIVNILNAGRWAPSAGNLQPWKFVVIQTPETIKNLATACLQQEWMESAKTVIVVCALPERTKTHYGKKGEEIFSYQDCAAAIENMLLMIHYQKLGACWVGAFDENEVKRAIGVPGDVRVEAVLPIGYPDLETPTPPRFTLEKVTFLEGYGNRITNIEKIAKDYGVNLERTMKRTTDKLAKYFDKIKNKIKEKKKQKE